MGFHWTRIFHREQGFYAIYTYIRPLLFCSTFVLLLRQIGFSVESFFFHWFKCRGARLRKHCDRGFCCRGGDLLVVCRIRRRYFSIASFDGIFQVYVNKILCTRAFLVLLCVRACIQYYSMHNSIYKGGLKCTCENLRFYSKLISILPRNNLWVCPSFFIRETIYFIPWIISYTYEEVKLRLYIVNIRDTRNYIKITNIFIDKINISSRSFEKYLGKRFISFAI